MGMHRSTTQQQVLSHLHAAAKSGGSVGHKIYTQLMNGVSHMLPLVVGGGILIAIAFLIDGLSVDLKCTSGRSESKLWYHHSGSSSV